MTYLRQTCIEAMAAVIQHKNPYCGLDPNVRICPQDEDLATAAFDVLLSTLTDHASTWATETSNRYMTTAAFQADTDEEAHIHNLLAVLRGSGE